MIRVRLRVMRIARVRREREAREWAEDRVAWQRRLDEVEARWWAEQSSRIFGR
jgi:hypothetical protein